MGTLDGGLYDTPTKFAPQPGARIGAGTIIDGRYEIVDLIGSGGMCTVYRARHLQLDKTVAIKILATTVGSSQDDAKRFQREAQTVSLLDHPNIVRGFGFGIFEDHPYMVIEHLQGESLAQRLQRMERIDDDSFRMIISQICDALAYAHNHGVVHRDLKPSNIMVIGQDQVKVLDFGIAKTDQITGDFQKLTQTGKILGTLLYISPEQCAGGQSDARSDIYSLGCLMYELLEGAPPFSAQTHFALMYQHAQCAPPSGNHLGAYAPLIKACLEKDPAQRPQNMSEIRRQLFNPSQNNLTVRQEINTRALVKRWLPRMAIIGAITGLMVLAILLLHKAKPAAPRISGATLNFLRRTDPVRNIRERALKADAELRPLSDATLAEELTNVSQEIFSLAFTLESLHDDKNAKYWFQRDLQYLKQHKGTRQEMLIPLFELCKLGPVSEEKLRYLEEYLALSGPLPASSFPQKRQVLSAYYMLIMVKAAGEADQNKIESYKQRALGTFAQTAHCAGVQEDSKRLTSDLRIAIPPKTVRIALSHLSEGQDSTTDVSMLRKIHANYARLQQCLSTMRKEPHEETDLLQLYLHLATCAEQANEIAQSKEYTDRAMSILRSVESRPSSETYDRYEYAASVYRRLGFFKESEDICEDLIESFGGDHSKSVYAGELARWGLIRSQRYDKDSPAVEKFLEAAAVESKSPDNPNRQITVALYKCWAISVTEPDERADRLAYEISKQMEELAATASNIRPTDQIRGILSVLAHYYGRANKPDMVARTKSLEAVLLPAAKPVHE